MRNVAACDNLIVKSMRVQLSEPSRLFASAMAGMKGDAVAGRVLRMTLQLVPGVDPPAATAAVAATMVDVEVTASTATAIPVAGVLINPGSLLIQEGKVIPAGTYTLRLFASASGSCAAGNIAIRYPVMSYIKLGAA